MRHFWVIMLAAVAGNAAGSERCEISLDDLLERYVAARGGHEAIEKQTALRLNSTHHEGKWNPTFDFRVMKPGYMWISATYDDGFVYTEGFDGTRGWEKPGDKPAEYVDGAAGRALNQGAMSPIHLYGLHHMESLGAILKVDGCTTIDDTNYYVVNVMSRFGTDIDYYLNRETFIVERGRSVRPLHPTADPTPITIEERWSDFRTVVGVLHPFAYSQWNVDTGEKLSWLEVHSISRDDEASPADFAKP
jgi:hypothetical protein